MDVLESRWS